MSPHCHGKPCSGRWGWLKSGPRSRGVVRNAPRGAVRVCRISLVRQTYEQHRARKCHIDCGHPSAIIWSFNLPPLGGRYFAKHGRRPLILDALPALSTTRDGADSGAPARKVQTLGDELRYEDLAHEKTKAVPEKNGLSKTTLADSSASINWVRFQGYHLSSRLESTPRLYSVVLHCLFYIISKGSDWQSSISARIAPIAPKGQRGNGCRLPLPRNPVNSDAQRCWV
jgi:hypothetical protein